MFSCLLFLLGTKWINWIESHIFPTAYFSYLTPNRDWIINIYWSTIKFVSGGVSSPKSVFTFKVGFLCITQNRTPPTPRNKHRRSTTTLSQLNPLPIFLVHLQPPTAHLQFHKNKLTKRHSDTYHFVIKLP